MFGIGTGELLLLLLIALLVLGPERMPKLARDLGKTMNDLRKTSDELRTEFLNADRTLNAEKLLEVAAKTAAAPAATPGPATVQDEVPPGVGATQAAPAAKGGGEAAAEKNEVASDAPPIPAEPEETAFDREARLARERIDRGG